MTSGKSIQNSGSLKIKHIRETEDPYYRGKAGRDPTLTKALISFYFFSYYIRRIYFGRKVFFYKFASFLLGCSLPLQSCWNVEL